MLRVVIRNTMIIYIWALSMGGNVLVPILQPRHSMEGVFRYGAAGYIVGLMVIAMFFILMFYLRKRPGSGP